MSEKKSLRIKNVYCIFFYFHEELLIDEGEREKGGEMRKTNWREREGERENKTYLIPKVDFRRARYLQNVVIFLFTCDTGHTKSSFILTLYIYTIKVMLRGIVIIAKLLK